MRYNFTVACNAMPMFVWGNRKFDWWIGDAWSETGVGPSSIVMFGLVSYDAT